MHTIKRAFIDTLPVLAGYLFAGTAFGLLLFSAGFGWPWAVSASVLVYAGSLQFLLVPFLAQGAHVFTVLIMSLAVNSRHIFYGLSFIESFRQMGWRRPYMIFSLTDETYSLLCLNMNTPNNTPNYYFSVALLNQCYWVAGSLLGSLAGALLPLATTGVDFAMTALFVVIFTEQWLASKSKLPAAVGLACGLGCLLAFGPDAFILPALLLSVLALLLLQPKLEVAQ